MEVLSRSYQTVHVLKVNLCTAKVASIGKVNLCTAKVASIGKVNLCTAKVVSIGKVNLCTAKVVSTGQTCDKNAKVLLCSHRKNVKVLPRSPPSLQLTAGNFLPGKHGGISTFSSS